MPPLDRFPLPSAASPSPQALRDAVALLRNASKPLVMIGRVSNGVDDWDARVALAERLGAIVLTDIKTGASFPTAHPRHPFPPSLYVNGAATSAIRDADVILSLDWIDLGGTVRQACEGTFPTAKVISCSLDEYLHNGWNMDYQALPPADVAILASPDACVAALLDALGPRGAPAPAPWLGRTAAEAAPAASASDCMPLAEMARVTTDALAAHDPSYIRLPLGWPGEFCRFAHPMDYIGFDGGGGIGSGPGMAVGAALAMRGGDRLPVAVLGDGDYLMGLTALWTGVRYKVPVLIVVANNLSFFNDELHQERVARLRGRPVENKHIGLRMSDPEFDLAGLARNQGAQGIGPVRTPAELASALKAGIDAVKAGHVFVIDARVAPEYARAQAGSLMRHIPQR
jgi:thiamine pyrophosphate-dependent acetolactate synthase large subunit-like protein